MGTFQRWCQIISLVPPEGKGRVGKGGKAPLKTRVDKRGKGEGGKGESGEIM